MFLLSRYYADLVGEEFYHNYKTAVYLAGSASAEFFADIGLCPFEAVKVCGIPLQPSVLNPNPHLSVTLFLKSDEGLQRLMCEMDLGAGQGADLSWLCQGLV